MAKKHKHKIKPHEDAVENFEAIRCLGGPRHLKTIVDRGSKYRFIRKGIEYRYVKQPIALRHPTTNDVIYREYYVLMWTFEA